MSKIAKVMSVSMITNAFLSLLKVVLGFFGKSNALIADGVHSFSDLSTDLVAIFGDKISKKPADEKHPYGHGKSEYITSMIIGMVIILLGFGIITNSINRKIVIPSAFVIGVSAFTIIAKFVLASYILKKGKAYNNNILLASGKESFTDVISSFVVLASTILMQFSGTTSILKYADTVASIIVGIMIIRVGFQVLRENMSIMLGEQESNCEYLEQVKDVITYDKRIRKIDRLTLLKYGAYYELNCEVSLDEHLSLLEAHQIIDDIEKKLKRKDNRIKYITIHMNPYPIEK